MCAVAGVLFSIAVLTGCATEPKSTGTPIETVWESPATKPAPAPPAAAAEQPASASQPASETAAPAFADPAEVIARVNGRAIARGELAEMLIDSHGLSVLEQLVLLTAARQRAAEMSLTVSAADITAAQDDALRRLASPVGNPDEQPLDRQVAERLLDELLVAKNVSRSEWDRRMEQQAYLRKIAAAEVEKMTVTPEMLKQEYALAYGERVQIRHIQVSSLDAVRRVRDQLEARKDFELVARESSENQITAARGGLMPPFTHNDQAVTPLIREAAFSLTVGQVSPAINEGNWYHIIRLERRFPASEVGFENVDQNALRRRLLDRLIQQRQTTLEAELFSAAVVDITDRELRRQFRLRHEKPPQ